MKVLLDFSQAAAACVWQNLFRDFFYNFMHFSLEENVLHRRNTFNFLDLRTKFCAMLRLCISLQTPEVKAKVIYERIMFISLIHC